MADFDGANITVNCPDCDTRFDESVARLKAAEHTTCPACQQIIVLAKDPSHDPLDHPNEPLQWIVGIGESRTRH